MKYFIFLIFISTIILVGAAKNSKKDKKGSGDHGEGQVLIGRGPPSEKFNDNPHVERLRSEDGNSQGHNKRHAEGFKEGGAPTTSEDRQPSVNPPNKKGPKHSPPCRGPP